MKRLGGRVTGIHVAGTGDRMLAATSQDSLLCYDLQRSLIWHRLFERGIGNLTPMEDRVLVVDASGGLRSVDLAGDVVELDSLPGTCSFALAVGSRVCLASGSAVFYV